MADRISEAEILTRDASRWVTQLASGEATIADAEALARWRRQSPAHEAAFIEAVRVWKSLEPGGRAFIDREGMPDWSRQPSQLTRRAILGGGGALAAAAAAYAIINPPLGLWPSFDELRADYRTATGEQRRVALADVIIDMNTQTSITVPNRGSSEDDVKLIAGEASFTLPAQSQRSLTVLAGSGRMVTTHGRFDVRNIDRVVCVTCTDGEVKVEKGQQSVMLAAGGQLSYDDRGLGQSRAIDTAEATAWQDGFIVFRSTPLLAAVAEINRYRSGRVILLNSALEKTPLSGRFRIKRINEILAWIEEVVGTNARELPGGIVILS